MDIKKILQANHGKETANQIAEYIGNNSSRFDQLMQLFFSRDYPLCQRAAMAVGHTSDKNLSLIEPYLDDIILILETNPPVALKRNIVRLLQKITIPASLLERVTNVCFEFLMSKKEPVAVKVFAMTVLANICKKETGLSNELRLIIEEQLPYASAGFKSRACKILPYL